MSGVPSLWFSSKGSGDRPCRKSRKTFSSLLSQLSAWWWEKKEIWEAFVERVLGMQGRRCLPGMDWHRGKPRKCSLHPPHCFFLESFLFYCFLPAGKCSLCLRPAGGSWPLLAPKHKTDKRGLIFFTSISKIPGTFYRPSLG